MDVSNLDKLEAWLINQLEELRAGDELIDAKLRGLNAVEAIAFFTQIREVGGQIRAITETLAKIKELKAAEGAKE